MKIMRHWMSDLEVVLITFLYCESHTICNANIICPTFHQTVRGSSALSPETGIISKDKLSLS